MHANRWMRGLKSTTLLSMPPGPLFELHIFHPDTNTRTRLVNSRTHLHYPSQKPDVRGIRKPPRRARRGAQTCSHESRRMFSHEHQSTDWEPASPDPTRVLTEGESDIRERRNRPHLSAWGLRLTHIIIAEPSWLKLQSPATAGHAANWRTAENDHYRSHKT